MRILGQVNSYLKFKPSLWGWAVEKWIYIKIKSRSCPSKEMRDSYKEKCLRNWKSVRIIIKEVSKEKPKEAE